MHRLTVLAAAFLLSVSSGFLTGRVLAVPSPTLQQQPDTRDRIPVVTLEGVQNGLLHGTITGNARLHMAKSVVVQSGAFAIDASAVLRNEVLVTVPIWATYVASKRGKKYYSVLSAAGERIVPANRVYFSSEAEAQNAGYVQ